MKYTCEISINKPLNEVIEKFDSVENMKHWQSGLISFKNIEGTPGEEGARSKLVYKMGNRNMEMIETIIKKRLPEEFHGSYEADGVFNMQKNYFSSIDENTTKWVSESEFKFSKLSMKVFGFLMPGAFKKQSLKYMTDFKNFVEHNTSVADA